MRIGSLFSGIGGLELGLEMSGLGHTVWQVEQNAFCRRVLDKHWPHVRIHKDVHNVGKHNLEQVDLICGGFPCQPFSTASRGRRVATDLWPEMRRIVAELLPTWVVAENVSRQAVEKAATDLQSRYQTACIELSASVVGAPHERRRWFLVAHAYGEGEPHVSVDAEMARVPDMAGRVSWKTFPQGVGVDDGVPYRMDRLRALGNAVVPQCAEVIGHMIKEIGKL